MAHALFKIPNLISLGRLMFVVSTAWFLAQPEPVARLYALIFLTLAAVSDFFDGFMARRLNQHTRLGLILDPLTENLLFSPTRPAEELYEWNIDRWQVKNLAEAREHRETLAALKERLERWMVENRDQEVELEGM